MLESPSSTPCRLKFSTSFTRADIVLPRSITIGLYPLCDSSSAAKIPHGPNPMTTGRPVKHSLPDSGACLSICLYTLHLCFLAVFDDICEFVVKSTVYTMKIFNLSLASIDSRATCQVIISDSFMDSCFAILAGSSVISAPTGSLISLILYAYFPALSPPRHTLFLNLASISHLRKLLRLFNIS